MNLRVSRIALLSLLSVIPLAANDHDPEILANDIMTVHPETEIQENLTSGVTSDIVKDVEKDAKGVESINVEHSDVDNGDDSADENSAIPQDEDNSAENDTTEEITDPPRQAQHEDIDTDEEKGMPVDDNHKDEQHNGNGATDGDALNEDKAPEESKTNKDRDVNKGNSSPEIEDNAHINESTIISQETVEQEETQNNDTEGDVNINATHDSNGSTEDDPSLETDSTAKDVDAGNIDTNDDWRDQQSSEGQKQEEERHKPVAIDYANKSTGALILDKSPDFQGTSNLLVADKDKYAMIPCDKEGVKYVIIGLSEEILVKTIVLSSYEKFSSRTKRFEVLGSQTYPAMSDWEELGVFDAKPWYKENKEQVFELGRPSWARYLKFRFLDHYGDEHYCAYTQIKVHGSTTLQGFHEMQQEAQAEAEAGTKPLEFQSDVPATDTNDALPSDGKETSDGPSEIDYDEKVNETDANTNKVNETDELSGDNNSDEVVEESSTESTSPQNSTGGGGGKSQESDAPLTKEANKSEDSFIDTDADDSNSSKVSIGADSQTSETLESPSHADKHEDAELSQTSVKNGHIEADEEPGSSEPIEVDNAASHSNDNTTREGTAENQSLTPATNDAKKAKGTEEGESVPAPASSMTDAVHSAINSVKKVALMKDAVKGIHHIIKTKTSGTEEGSHEVVDDDGKHEANSASSTQTMSEQDVEALGERKVEDSASASEDKPEGRAHQDKKNDNSKAEDSQKDTENETMVPNSNNDEIDDALVQETLKEAQFLLSQLSGRFSNAACLDILDFAEWKRNKIQSGNLRLKGSNSGEKQKQNEPIFVKLTDEIKWLEASQSIYEEYIRATTSCYRHVILDLGTELLSQQKKQEHRLYMLEEHMDYLQKQLEKKDLQTHLYEAIIAIKTNLQTVIFPNLLSWWLYTKSVALRMVERFIENEYVQKLIVLIGMYQQFLCGFLLSYIFIVLTTKRENTKSKGKRDKRRTRRKQTNLGAISKTTNDIMEVVISPSLQTDVEDDSL